MQLFLSNQPGSAEWAYQELETGRRAVFTNVKLVPLSYADLVNAANGDRLIIPLNWQHAEVVRSEIPGIEPGQIASVSTSLETDFKSKGIGLVAGGWLPSGLAVTAGMTVLLDRCIVVDLVGRFRNGEKKRIQDKDFLDLFNQTGLRINPVLYTFEGKAQDNPTLAVMRDQLEWAARALQVALPKAFIAAADEFGLKGAIGLLQDGQAKMTREKAFLLDIAPHLAGPIAGKKRDAIWELIVGTAQTHGVEKNSLVVLAALSAVSVANGKSPARGLLKFKPAYSSKEANNALADLRSIKLLMAMFGLIPKHPTMLCTSDKDLALFWLGIGASGFTNDEGRASCLLSPTTDLLPGDSLAKWSTLVGAHGSANGGSVSA
ncbi:hypothetical protein Q3C01_28050 [Bradyrhizobium sp. UFLA05-109]